MESIFISSVIHYHRSAMACKVTDREDFNLAMSATPSYDLVVSFEHFALELSKDNGKVMVS